MQGPVIGFIEDPPGCVDNKRIAVEGGRYLEDHKKMPRLVLSYGTETFTKAVADWGEMYFGCKFVPVGKWDALPDFSKPPTPLSPMSPRNSPRRDSPRSSESSPRTPHTPRTSRRLSRKNNSPRKTLSHFDKWEPMLRKCDYVVVFHRGNSSNYWLPALPQYENLLYAVHKVLN